MRDVKTKNIRVLLSIVTLVLLVGAAAPAAADTAMTAGVVLEEMPVRERSSYVMGIVEGLAYSRFRKDTHAAGQNDETGMKCVYDWFYRDSMKSLDLIEAAFRKYSDHYPSVLLAVMIKKECGE